MNLSNKYHKRGKKEQRKVESWPERKGRAGRKGRGKNEDGRNDGKGEEMERGLKMGGLKARGEGY